MFMNIHFFIKNSIFPFVKSIQVIFIKKTFLHVYNKNHRSYLLP